MGGLTPTPYQKSGNIDNNQFSPLDGIGSSSYQTNSSPVYNPSSMQ